MVAGQGAGGVGGGSSGSGSQKKKKKKGAQQASGSAMSSSSSGRKSPKNARRRKKQQREGPGTSTGSSGSNISGGNNNRRQPEKSDTLAKKNSHQTASVVHRLRCAAFEPEACVALRFLPHFEEHPSARSALVEDLQARQQRREALLAVVRESGDVELLRAHAVTQGTTSRRKKSKGKNDTRGRPGSGLAEQEDVGDSLLSGVVLSATPDALDADVRREDVGAGTAGTESGEAAPAGPPTASAGDTGMQHRHRRLRWVCEKRLSSDRALHTKSVVWASLPPTRQSPRGVPLRLYTAGLSGTIVRWDINETLRPHSEIDSHGGGAIWALEPSPCGRWLAAGCEDGCVRLFRVVRATDSDILAGRVSCARSEFAPPRGEEEVGDDGEASGSSSDNMDAGIGGFDDEEDTDDLDSFGRPTTGLVFARPLPRTGGRVTAIAWHPDHATHPGVLYSGGADGTIRSWNAVREDGAGQQGALVATMKVGSELGAGEQTVVWSLCALADGTLVSGDSRGAVRFWDGDAGVQSQVFENHEADVLCVRGLKTDSAPGSKSGTAVFAAGVDSKVCLFRRMTVTSETGESTRGSAVSKMKRWVLVASQRVHSHDVQAMDVFSAHIPGVDKSAKSSRRGGHIPDLLATGSVDSRVALHAAADIRAPASRLMPFPRSQFCSPSNVGTVSRTGGRGNPSQEDRLVLIQHPSFCRVWRVAVPSKRGMVSVKMLDEQIGDGAVPQHADALEGKPIGQVQTHRLLCELHPKVHSISCSALSENGRFVAVSGALETIIYEIQPGMDAPTVSRVRVRAAKAGARSRLPAAHRLCFGTSSGSPFLLLASRESPSRLLSFFLQSPASGRKAVLTPESIVPLPLPSSTEEDKFGPVTSLLVWREPAGHGQWLACGDAGNVTHVFWGPTVEGDDGRIPWQYYCTLPVAGSQSTALAFVDFPDLVHAQLPGYTGGTNAEDASTAALVSTSSENGLFVFALSARRMLRFKNAKQETESPLRGLVHPVVGIHELATRDTFAASVLCYGLNFVCRISFSIEPNSGSKVAKCLVADYQVSHRYKPLLLVSALPAHRRIDFSEDVSNKAGTEDDMTGEGLSPPLELVVCEQPWDRVNEMLPETLLRSKYAT